MAPARKKIKKTANKLATTKQPPTGKPGPIVTVFVRTRSFDRTYQKLPDPIKREFPLLVKEMQSGDYTPGRDLKQRKGTKKNQQKEWQVRLSRSHRMTFTFENGTATLLLIGEHKRFE